jgi:hypothetical protein
VTHYREQGTVDHAPPQTHFARFDAWLTRVECFARRHWLFTIVAATLTVAGCSAAYSAAVEALGPPAACADSAPVDGKCRTGQYLDRPYWFSGAVCRCRPR